MNIGIIEDSRTVAKILESTLRAYDHQVFIKPSNGIYQDSSPAAGWDLAVINCRLDSIDPVRLVKEIRKRDQQLYILAVSAREEWVNRVEILNAGADDAIAYPFAMQEFLAKVNALLSRPRSREKNIYRAGEIEVDPISRIVKVRNRIITLRKKEFGLLEYLIKHKERPVSRAELLDNVWDFRKVNGSNTVEVHISSLRKILKARTIDTVHGFGYQLYDSESVNYRSERGEKGENITKVESGLATL